MRTKKAPPPRIDVFTNSELLTEVQKRGLWRQPQESSDDFTRRLRLLFQTGRDSEVESVARKHVNDQFGTCY